MLSMKPSQLIDALLALLPQHQAVHLWGACGIGKSQLIAQVAARLKSNSAICGCTARPG